MNRWLLWRHTDRSLWRSFYGCYNHGNGVAMREVWACRFINAGFIRVYCFSFFGRIGNSYNALLVFMVCAVTVSVHRTIVVYTSTNHSKQQPRVINASDSIWFISTVRSNEYNCILQSGESAFLVSTVGGLSICDKSFFCCKIWWCFEGARLGDTHYRTILKFDRYFKLSRRQVKSHK